MQWKITLSAGSHDRRVCPVSVPLPGPVPAALGGAALPVDCPAVRGGTVQMAVDGGAAKLWLLLDGLDAGQTVSFVVDGAGAGRVGAGVEFVPESPDRLRVDLAGEPFTVLNSAATWARPFLYPVLGPGGEPVTRHYPMVPDAPGEDRDHPHHKSLYVAHGDVNGADVWSEAAGHGRQVQEALLEAAPGPVCGALRTRNRWQRANGEALLRDERLFRFYAVGPEARLFDMVLSFRADFGDVVFGDTKEGGLLSIRMAESMKEARGGRIENGYGAVSERECWGQAAPWVDYSGPLAGGTFGTAILDHPANPRYPTRWHVRAYGLFTANPFGLSHYRAGYETNGSLALGAGRSLVFAYRVYLHRGTAAEAGTRERFLDFAVPVAAKAEAL